MKYKKDLEQLSKVAIKWWPKSLEADVAKLSVIPKLIETQDQFIALLKISGESPEQIFDVLKASAFQPNLFLKHLVVLTDYGGELIKRLGTEFPQLFPQSNKNNPSQLDFIFKNKTHSYTFEALPVKGLSNSKLGIDGESILIPGQIDGLLKDLTMILLFGGSSTVADFAALERCEIGSLLGNPVEIDKYVREKYIHVSRITTGASANSLGQIAQTYVADFLRKNLDISYAVQRNGSIQLRGYDKQDGMPFDVVIERKGKKVGVEVSFQVTSNSVIERKAGQAESRLQLMSHEGHFIAYVLDGAGNFSRTAALSTICNASDCTVAYSDPELSVLVEFIRGKLDDSLR